MALATTLAKQTNSWMSSSWPILMSLLTGAVIALTVLLFVLPFKLPYVLYLNDAGCVVAKEAGLNPTPVQDRICSIEGRAEVRERSIVISGVFLDRAYVIAGKELPR